MRFMIPATVLIAAVSASGVEWSGPEISGLFEHQLSVQRSYDRWPWTAHNQLRLTLRSDQGTGISAEATLAAIAYHGYTELSTSDFVPELLQSQLQTPTILPFENRIFLDRALVDLRISGFRIVTGIQPLRWGTGYAWNPTDLFTVKSPTDPTYIEEGVNAFKISIPWRIDGYIAAVVVPEDNWNSSGKAVKWLDHIVGFDVSALYLERTLEPIPIPAPTGKERYVGWDLAGGILGPGVWSEGTILLDPDRHDALRMVLGADYTTSGGWYFKVEGFHNGDGHNSSDDYTVDDWRELMYRTNIFLGKNYGLIGVEKTVADFWRLALYGITNISDGSIIINPWIYYDVSSSCEAILSAALPIGEDIAEFHPGTAAAFLRLNVYF